MKLSRTMTDREACALGKDLIVELATYPTGQTDPPCEEHTPLVGAMAVALLVITAGGGLDVHIARSVLMAAYRLGQISMED